MSQKDNKDLAVSPNPGLPAADPGQMLQLIERMATNKDVDVAKLNALLDLQERIMDRNATVECNIAFARVVAGMPILRKNGIIDFSSSSKPNQKPIPYAKWEDMQKAIRPIYEAEGFTVSYDSKPHENGWSVWTAIATHRNGKTKQSSITLPMDTSGGKQNIQGMGSTSSYAQRYTTKNLFNLQFEGEDDDGFAGSMQYINEQEIGNIQRLIKETNADGINFCKALGVSSIENITKKKYVTAVNALLAKKAKTGL